MMTDEEFDEMVYENYVSMLNHPGESDEYELLWLAAMRCALNVDRDEVRRFCERDKPPMDGYRLKRRQFTAFKKIATRNKKTKEVDLKSVHDRFSSRVRKEQNR